MRKLLILSVLTVLAAGATGCASRNPCGGSSSCFSRVGSWFGGGRQNNADCCCDPCGGGGTVMPTVPCCQ